VALWHKGSFGSAPELLVCTISGMSSCDLLGMIVQYSLVFTGLP